MFLFKIYAISVKKNVRGTRTLSKTPYIILREINYLWIMQLDIHVRVLLVAYTTYLIMIL